MTDSTPHTFRDYNNAPDRVREFYKKNHTCQTLQFVIDKKQQYKTPQLFEMSTWDMLMKLDTFIDESDPDTEFSQLQHALQCAQAARKAGEPRWLQLVMLIHDMGKVLAFNGEPQYAIVGDTFPVGVQFSDKIVYSKYFVLNPDSKIPEYNTALGIYKANCGLDNVHMSWGHDEYLYLIMQPYLSKESLFCIRYHSFYAAHSFQEYQNLMTKEDVELMEYIKRFNKYDLYSKDCPKVDVESVKEYYLELISEFLPNKLKW